MSNGQKRVIIYIMDGKQGRTDMEKMPEIIVAVYENGMLRPTVPV